MFKFEVASTLHKFGVTEDGDDVVGQLLFVEAIDDKGNRFVHRQHFPALVEVEREDDLPGYHDRYDEAFVEASKLKHEVEHLTELDDDWERSFPVYGSEAYNEQDTIDWEQDRDN